MHVRILVVSIAVIAGAAVVTAVAVGFASTGEIAGASCQAQAQQQSVVVTPTPSGTETPAPPQPPRTKASNDETNAAREADSPAAAASQLTAEGSGRPQAVDAQGQPVAGAAQLVFVFGSDRDAITRRQAFLLPEGMKAEDITVTLPFQDVVDDEGHPLTPAHFRAVVGPAGPGLLVTIAFCLNPMTPSEMDPGTYTGTAFVGVDERVSAVSLQATVQDDRPGLVALFALAGVIGGLFIRLFADKRSSDRINSLHEVSASRIAVTVGTGLVVGFYSFRTIYLDDPTFDGNFGDLFRVTAEVFAGTLAAKTITDLAGKQEQPAKRGKRRQRKAQQDKDAQAGGASAPAHGAS